MVTNKVIQLPNHKVIMEEASEWMVRLDSSRLSKKEVLELTKWLEQSELHKQTFKDMVQVWDQMDVMEGLSELLPLDDFPKKTSHEPYSRFASPVMASVFVCVIGLSLFLNHWLSREAIYETSIGVVQNYSMDDGSEITLNTASRIETEFDWRNRNINLQQGEAFFDVAHNEDVPFIVTAGNISVQAVGTAFSVQKIDDVIEVTVTDGKVKIASLDDDLDAGALDVIYASKGQMVKIDKNNKTYLSNINAEQVAQVLMWQKKMLAFNGEPLRDVIKEFGRYTEIELLIADKETADIRVGGYFRSNDLKGLLRSLHDNFDISSKQINQSTFLLSREVYE